MILNIAVLLSFQLLGEVLARGAQLPLPGPVLGMALLLVAFLLRPALADRMLTTTQGLLSHLSLLFVPAGVGVISHADLLGRAGTALIGAVVISTFLALCTGALTFALLSRLTRRAEGDT